MSYCEFFSMRVVAKPRKVHRCFGCGLRMRPGVPHTYEAGKWEGDFFEARMCTLCHEALQDDLLDTSEGYSEGDVLEARAAFAENLGGRFEWSTGDLYELRPDLYQAPATKEASDAE